MKKITMVYIKQVGLTLHKSSCGGKIVAKKTARRFRRPKVVSHFGIMLSSPSSIGVTQTALLTLFILLATLTQDAAAQQGGKDHETTFVYVLMLIRKTKY